MGKTEKNGVNFDMKENNTENFRIFYLSRSILFTRMRLVTLRMK